MTQFYMRYILLSAMIKLLEFNFTVYLNTFQGASYIRDERVIAIEPGYQSIKRQHCFGSYID